MILYVSIFRRKDVETARSYASRSVSCSCQSANPMTLPQSWLNVQVTSFSSSAEKRCKGTFMVVAHSLYEPRKANISKLEREVVKLEHVSAPHIWILPSCCLRLQNNSSEIAQQSGIERPSTISSILCNHFEGAHGLFEKERRTREAADTDNKQEVSKQLLCGDCIKFMMFTGVCLQVDTIHKESFKGRHKGSSGNDLVVSYPYRTGLQMANRDTG
ncbi:hypothetical protein Tco_0949149 [Tanacetum coccineum]